MAKANRLMIIIEMCILFCGSCSLHVLGNKTNLLSVNNNQQQQQQQHLHSDVNAGSDDGICKLMVHKHGYVCHEHTVTTQDGFILSLQRIPEGKSGGSPANRPPVLLQHGVLMDGITWLLLPPEESLAMVLADNGFDVWIANTRGTKYSRAHTSLTPDDPAFWNWSWDELVAYDLPATLKYVNDQSGQKVHYVGHSLGTLMGIAGISSSNTKGEKEIVKMMRTGVMLCPIAHVSQLTSPLATSAAYNNVAETLYKWGYYEFAPRGETVVKILKDVCNKAGFDCTDLLTSFTGKNCCLKSSIVDIFLDHEPQSSSTKNMIHLSQMIREGTIAKFDYKDEQENKKHYGQSSPPEYKINEIPKDFPMMLSYGGEDALSDVKDVELLLQSLKDHDGDKLLIHYTQDYAHADYVMASNAKQYVYHPLIAFFKLHSH